MDKTSIQLCTRTAMRTRGFSLVELLIATAIGMFLMSAIVQVFTQSQMTVSVNQSVNEMQDRGRSLLQHLGYHLAQRGHQGCLPPVALNIQDVPNIDWTHDYAARPVASSLPNRSHAELALRSYEVSAAGVFSPVPLDADIQALANGSLTIAPRPLSDVISVQYGDRRSVAIANAMGNSNEVLTLAPNDLDLQVGELVMVGDCASLDIFTITSVNNIGGAVELGHSNASNRSGSFNKPYGTNAELRRLRVYTYFVGDSGRVAEQSQPIFSLYRLDGQGNVIEIGDGIDYLQASYQVSTQAGLQNMTAASADFNSMQVTGVQLGLLVVGLKNVLLENDAKTYRLPSAVIGPAATIPTPANRFLKTPFQTFVEIRNRA